MGPPDGQPSVQPVGGGRPEKTLSSPPSWSRNAVETVSQQSDSEGDPEVGFYREDIGSEVPEVERESTRHGDMQSF